MLKASRAVSDVAAVKEVPAVAVVAGVLNKKFDAVPGLTVIVVEPVTVGLLAAAASVALSALTSVAFSAVVLMPFVKETEVAGNVGVAPFGAVPGPDQATVCVPV